MLVTEATGSWKLLQENSRAGHLPVPGQRYLHGFDRQMYAAGLGKPVRHAENFEPFSTFPQFSLFVAPDFQQIVGCVTGRLKGLIRVKPGGVRRADVQVWTNDSLTGYGHTDYEVASETRRRRDHVQGPSVSLRGIAVPTS